MNFNDLTEWNAQFFREIKGHLRTHAVIGVAIASIIAQVILFFSVGNSVCLNYDAQRSLCLDYDWKQQYFYIYRALNYAIPMLLMVSGVYLLMGDLAKEQRKGTLNFIRMSPQSGDEIMLGKILGVPSLVYIGLLSAVPLHFWAGIHGGMTVAWLVGLYTLWIAGCAVFYTAGLLVVILGDGEHKWGEQSTAGAGSFVAFIVAMPYCQMLDFSWDIYQHSQSISDSVRWFFIPFYPNPSGGYFLALGTAIGLTVWLWKMLIRRYDNPHATVLSKTQSYGLVAQSQLWCLGFVFNYVTDSESLEIFLGMILFTNLWAFLILAACLSPHRQASIDWARYRHFNASHRSLWADLLWGEKSPAIVAMMVNMLITTAIWLTWILRWESSNTKLNAIFTVVLAVNLVLVYSTIIQWGLLIKNKQRQTIAGVATIASAILPAVILSTVSTNVNTHPTLWLFGVFGAPLWTTYEYAKFPSILVAILGQWAVFGFVNLQLTRQLKAFGASATKSLIPGISANRLLD